MSMRIHCPNPACPSPENVQLVSAVVAAGWSSGYVHTSAGGGSATTQTALSKQLEFKESGLMWWGRLVNSAGALATIPGICAGIPLAFVASAAAGSDQGLGLLAIALTVIGLPVGILLLFVIPGTVLRILGKPTYNKMRAQWWQLYYCPRCGSVFNPNTGRYTGVGGIKALYS